MRLIALLMGVLLVGGCGDEDPPATPDAAAAAPDAAPPPPDVAAGPDTPVADAGPQTEAGPFTVIVLPDTQFYANNYPHFFDAQAKWIIAQKEALNIGFVLHEGDIVDHHDIEGQWQNASRSLHLLDNVVPYVLAAGNHDIDEKTRAAPLMNKYFPVSQFMSQPWWKGTFAENEVQNSYQIFPVGGRMWLVLALEFGPRDEVLAWAKQVLDRHSTIPAIIVTHAYMYLDNERYDHVKYPDSAQKQFWGPHVYKLPGTINDGQEMWQKLVSKARNVQLVLSGHVPYPYSVSRLRGVRPDGSHVHELLANYQGCFNESPTCIDPKTGMRTMGGWAYLRIMTFDPANHRIIVRTYSPVLDQHLTDPANQFELDLED
jgi:hypothetical protein